MAELELLAAALGAPLSPGWQARLQPFAAALGRYLEVQVPLRGGAPEVVTLGRGDGFTDHILAHLERLGIDDGARDRFRSVTRYVGSATWGVKLPLTGEPGVAVYARKPLPVVEVARWLAVHGVARAATDAIEALAARLDKDHTHFVALDLTPGHPPRYQVYFTQYVEDVDEVGQRLAAAVDAAGLRHLWPDVARDHGILASPETTVWISLGVADGELVGSVKVDYSDVRLGTVALVVEGDDDAEDQAQRIDTTRLYLGRDRADYVGVRTGPPRQLTLYITRVREPEL